MGGHSVTPELCDVQFLRSVFGFAQAEVLEIEDLIHGIMVTLSQAGAAAICRC